MLDRLERALTILAAAAGLLVVVGAATPAVRNWMFPSESDYEMHVVDPWRYVVVGIGALPYLLAAATSVASRERWAARWSLLAASTLLSFAVAIATGFSIGVLFLPSTALLAVATLIVLLTRPANRQRGLATLAGPALATGIVALWVVGIGLLFGTTSGQCVTAVRFPDGRVERTITPLESSSPLMGVPREDGGTVEIWSCSSSVVSGTGALGSSALLVGAAALGILALRRPQARNS